MRISTGMIYDAGLASMQKRTSSLLNTQQQLSSGRRILKPSDDPVAAARALEVTQSQEVNASQATTRDNAKSTLGIIDGQLQSAGDLMVRVRELTVQAANATLSAADRRSVADELRARYEELLALANSRDGTGLYLFGGYQTSNQPFAGSVENGVAYGGDDGARTLKVSSSRELAISDSGNDVFMRIKNGNGTFLTGAQNDKSINLHTAAVASATVTDAAAWNDPVNSGNLQVKFWVDQAGTIGPANAPGAVYYDFVDAGTGNSLLSGGAAATAANAYMRRFQDGITLDLSNLASPTYDNPSAAVPGTPTFGANVVVSGVPANGDTFAVTRPGAGLISTAAVTVAAGHAGVTIDNGSVTDPAKWATNPGNMELRFWTDTTGGTLTAGRATGSVDVSALVYPYTFAAGNDEFRIALNGNPAVTATLAAGPHNTINDVVNAVQTAVNGALGLGEATVALNGSNQLVVTSTTLGTGSGIAVSALGGDTGFATLFDSGGGMTNVAGASTGGVQTPGYAVAGAAPGYPLTLAAPHNQFNLTLDLDSTPTAITVPATTYADSAALAAAVQLAIGGGATVGVDASNKLVVSSATTGPTSAVTLGAVGGNGYAVMFGGASTSTAGTISTAGTVFYDLVNADTGKSLYSNTTSTTGASGTYTHRYTSNAAISLSSSLSPAFDLGASVTVTGTPASGDAFTIQAGDAYNGNGHFVTEAKTTTVVNTGSGVVGAGEVLDPAKWNSELNSRNLEVRFWTDPATSNVYYDLVDKETEKSLFTDGTSTRGGNANSYTHAFRAGDSIRFSGLHSAYGNGSAGDFGISVTISGTPADGDAFSVQPSESESVFDTMGRLISALESGAPVGTAGNTHLSNEMARVLTSVGQIEDNFLSVRASIGSRLAEIDDLDSVGQDLELQYSETLSRLQDLDYADAITRLTRHQMELQAAQQSFANISQLSLFNYL